ncbi:Zinc finger A20 and AN1 domain-containing stress-associated protein 6 [Hibiscus syriacus]|uniref:Zinc finger A20 and AN1 domain-containing stress-associated protein 6 n=1 Tax=Hibiscus syriacus TaxID=106335 RepID=A0A6A2YCK9_HIBSY|nr:zinc finger A20 and AN1 domain-containing stress-associated protein 6-like [Hibiscus syriacus]KAE8673039.1 Zinc finger A20 and AN1 domain-containing stress-associated protein 6 [Hibiscus syriacus]
MFQKFDFSFLIISVLDLADPISSILNFTRNLKDREILKKMAEEHRCQTPEGHRLCVNNCGFFGSPATMNLCSKCYRDFRLKEQQGASSIKSSLSSSSPSSSSAVVESVSQAPLFTLPEVIGESPAPAVEIAPEAEQLPQQQQPNRCMVCRKRVGLTGFKCKCGTTFCGSHRYPENHGCTFDFKTVGRVEIARANPVVKADKLDKI